MLKNKKILLLAFVIGSFLNFASLLYNKETKTSINCEETPSFSCPNPVAANDRRGLPFHWVEQPPNFYGSSKFADKEIVFQNLLINEIILVALSFVGITAVIRIKKPN